MSTSNLNSNQPTTKPTSTPTRQGRKKLNPELAKIRPMEAIHHGWEALEALHRYRALQSRHLAQLLFLGFPDPNGKVRNEKAAQQAANRNCLRFLKNRQYVKVIDAPLRKRDRLMPMELNVLTTTGFQELQKHRKNLDLDPHPSYENPASIIFDRSFEHWFSTMSSAVAAEAAVKREGGEVTLYWDEHEIRRRAKRRQEPLEWGGLEPDAVIVMKIKEVVHVFMIEGDQGTESIQSDAPNSIRTKGHSYREFFIHHRPNDPLLAEHRQPTVHFICRSQTRLDNIRAEIERQNGKQAYWYTTFTWLQPPYSFLGEVWQVSGRDGFHSPVTLFQP